jgi:hypothetical protein
MRFLTMEYVEGETLSKAIPARGFATERFLSLAIGSPTRGARRTARGSCTAT